MPTLTEFVAPLSYSKLFKLKQCPKLFFSSEILPKINKQERGDSFLKVNAAKGVINHKFLEMLFNNQAQIDDFYSFVDQQPVPQKIKDAALANTFSMNKLYYSVKELVTSESKIHTELKINLNHLLEITSEYKKTFITGVIDFVVISPLITVLIDYKSFFEKDAQFRDQLELYNVLLLKQFPETKTVISYIGDLKTGELRKILTKDKHQIEEILIPQMKNSIINIDKLYPNYLVPEYFTSKKSKNCKWCSFCS
jgi:hypothetical protein